MKIIHWSDLHIRLASRHEEYRHVIDNFVAECRKEQPELIVFTGDLFHNKVHLSPESYDIAKYAFDPLVEIAPNVLIKGNHDQNLSGAYRMDAVSPFVRLFNADKPEERKIIFYEDSGVYEFDEDIRFVVYPMVGSEMPDASKIRPDKLNIGLYHGVVGGATTDTGFEFKKQDQRIPIPHEQLDAVLLGDIHKVQKLRENMAYAGSLIQQNWGEDPLRHGYIRWEFTDGKLTQVRAKRVSNEYGYYKMSYVNGEFQDPYDSIPPKATLKIVHGIEDLSEDIREKLSQMGVDDSYNVVFEEEGLNVDGEVVNVKQDILNVHNFENQQEIVRSFFAEDEDSEELLELNKKLFHDNKSQFEQESIRTVFGIDFIEFDNLFCYGENNCFLFSNKHGIIGFFSPNRSGKSSFLDALSFAIYGESPHTSTYDDIINRNRDEYRSFISLHSGNRKFSIERYGKRTGSGWNNSISFKEYDRAGEVVKDEGDMREAKKLIETYFGDAKNYAKTAYIYQNNDEKFLNLTPAKRKDWLYDNLGLEVFEVLHESAKKKSKDLKNKIDYLESEDIKDKLNQASLDKGDLAEELEKRVWYRDVTHKKIEALEDEIQSLRDRLKPLDESLRDRSEDIDNIHSKIESLSKEIEILQNKQVEEPQHLLDQINVLKHEVESMESTGYDHKLDEEKEKEKQLQDVVAKGKTTATKIQNMQKIINGLNTQIGEYSNEEKLQGEIDVLAEQVSSKWGVDSQIESLEGKIYSYKQEASLLTEDERYETETLCGTCPMLEASRNKKKEIPTLEQEYQELLQKSKGLAEKGKLLDELKAELKDLKKLKESLKYRENELSTLQLQKKNLTDKYNSLQNDLKSLESRRKEIMDQKIENKCTQIKSLEKEVQTNKKEQQTKINEDIKSKQNEINIQQERLSSAKKEQKRWEVEKKKLAHNEKINAEIQECNTDKTTLKREKETADNLVMDVKSSIKSIDDKIESLEQQYGQLRSLKEEYVVFEKYIKATHKNQIPLLIIQNMLNVLQSELNNVVTQLTDFRLRLFVENDNVKCNIKDHRGEREANRLSGMETFTCNLAFRIAIAQIGNMAVPNFLIVDEGFSAVDSTNTQEFPKLFSYLKDKFQFVMAVSHDEMMRDQVDYNIEISNNGTEANIRVED